MLTRAELCAVTGIDAERLKSLSRRGQLPVDVGFEDMSVSRISDVRDGLGHQRHPEWNALALAALNDFTRDGGAPLSAAAKSIFNGLGYVRHRGINIGGAAGGPDLWMGAVRLSTAGGADAGAGHVGGTLMEVQDQIAGWQQRNSGDHEFAARIFIVNVSNCYRSVLARAEQFGGQELRNRIVNAIEGSR